MHREKEERREGKEGGRKEYYPRWEEEGRVVASPDDNLKKWTKGSQLYGKDAVKGENIYICGN